MLFSFFLKKILQKALTIPLAAGMVYPTLGGNLVVRSVKLRPPENQSSSLPSLSVRKAKINPRWKTFFDEVVKVDYVELHGFRAEVDVRDPLMLLHCLYNAKCLSQAHLAAQRARLAAQTLPAENDAESKDQPEPLIVRTEGFSLKDGELILHNGSRRLFVEIVEATGESIQLPLGSETTSLRADLLVRQTEDGPAAPIKVLLTWNGATEVLETAMTLSDLPLSYFGEVFPQLQEKAAKLLASPSPAFAGGSLITNGASTTNGVLSGALTLEFRAAAQSGSKWQLK